MMLLRFGFVSGFALAMVGCSAGGGTDSGLGASTGAGGSGSGNPDGGGAGQTTGTGGVLLNPPLNTAGANGGDPNAPCEAVVQQAEKLDGGRADIIFVIDNSGSMTEEALAVQANLNAFSQRIASSGIDAHVVVISSGPPGGQGAQCADIFACLGQLITQWGDANGVCIDPPLGLPGACPANDETNEAAGFFHWHEEVGSHDALAKIQGTFGNWQHMLRPDAAKTFVVVTDDDNEPAPTGAEFAGWVDSQPVFQGAVWRFSGIFCVTDGNNCANVGATYTGLVQQTAGLSGDMAQFATGQIDAQFSAVFDSLAQAIVADAVPVDCEWDIPPPPEGETFDPNAVNVKYTPTGGQAQTIFSVDSDTQCTEQYGGWYYDDPLHPTRVVACPQSCAVMQADDGARVEVLFGCARERPPLM